MTTTMTKMTKTTKMAKIAILRSADGDIKREPVPRNFRPKRDGYAMPNGKTYFVVCVLRVDDDADAADSLYTHPARTEGAPLRAGIQQRTFMEQG